MAFFPHVNPGETFVPSAVLENNIRDCINASGVYGTRPQSAGAGNTIRVTVYNAGSASLPAGAAVSVDFGGSSKSANGVAPCVLFDGRTDRPWGILDRELSTGAAGDAVMAGFAVVKLANTGNAGDGVMPVPMEKGDTDQMFAAIPGGAGTVLFSAGNETPILLGWRPEYAGQFKIVITGTLTSGTPTEDSSAEKGSSSSSPSSSSPSSSGEDSDTSSGDYSSTSSGDFSSTSSWESSDESNWDSSDESWSERSGTSQSWSYSSTSSSFSSSSQSQSQGGNSESGSDSNIWPESEDSDSGGGNSLGVSGTGVLGVENGKLTVYPTGSCDGDDGGSGGGGGSGGNDGGGDNPNQPDEPDESDEPSSDLSESEPSDTESPESSNTNSNTSSSLSEGDFSNSGSESDTSSDWDSESSLFWEDSSGSETDSESSTSSDWDSESSLSNESSSGSETDSEEDSSSSSSEKPDDSSSAHQGNDEQWDITLAVVDGANFSNSVCGVVDLGTSRRSIPRTVFGPDVWKTGSDTYIWIEGKTIKTGSSYPAPTSGTFRKLLGRVVYRSGAYAVVQEQCGPVVENWHTMLTGG